MMDKVLLALTKIIEILNFAGFIINMRDKYNQAQTSIKIEKD